MRSIRELSRWSLLSFVLIGMLVLAACGADDDPEEVTADGADPEPEDADGPDDSDDAEEEPGAPGEMTTIHMAVNNPILQPGLSFMWLQNHFGWYEEEGIELDVATTQGGADSTQRLIAGQIDVGVPPPSQILRAVAEGQDPGLISVYAFRRHGQYDFVVLPDSDIESIDDLRGRQVGVSSLGDEGVIFTEATIREKGWGENDIEIIAVGPAGEGYAALEAGNVDALALPAAQYAIIEALGNELRFLDPPNFADSIFGNQIVVQRDWAEENADLVRRYLRSWTKGQIFFMENPRAALEIHFELFPETVPSGLTPEEAVERQVATLEASIETMRFDDQECQRWGCNTVEEWEAYIDYVGVTVEEVGSPEELFTNDYLDLANEIDVEEIRQLARDFELDG